MKRIPYAQGVRQALRGVRAATQKALNGLNQVASERMAKGDYATAEELVAKGRELQQFQAEVDALRRRWRELCGAGGPSAKQSVTPLWAYYQPILEALASVGGESRRTELEQHVERLMAGTLLPGDREPMPSGRERWRAMIQRARKPLVAEGWIENRIGHTWVITESGKRAAMKKLTEDPSEGV